MKKFITSLLLIVLAVGSAYSQTDTSTQRLQRLLSDPGLRPDTTAPVPRSEVPDKAHMRQQDRIEMLPRPRSACFLVYGGWSALRNQEQLTRITETGWNYGLGTQSFFHRHSPWHVRTDFSITGYELRRQNLAEIANRTLPGQRVITANNPVFGHLAVGIGYNQHLTRFFQPYAAVGVGALVPIEEARFYMANETETDRTYGKYKRRLGVTANAYLGASAGILHWLHVFGEFQYSHEMSSNSRIELDHQYPAAANDPTGTPRRDVVLQTASMRMLNWRLGLRFFVNGSDKD